MFSVINSPQLSTGHKCMTYPRDSSLHNLPKITLHTVLLILTKRYFWNQKDLKAYVSIHKMRNFKVEVAWYYLIWPFFFFFFGQKYTLNALNMNKETKLNVKEQ